MTRAPSFEIFEEALALKAPWKIDDISIKPNKNNGQEIHVFLSCPRESMFIDPTGLHRPIHDTYNKTWQHIDVEQKRCYIHCPVPRIKTTAGPYKTIDVPWARPSSRFTLAFEANVMREIEAGKTFRGVAKEIGEESHSIWTIFNGWVNTAYKTNTVDNTLAAIGIDEISDPVSKNPITALIDLKNERVLYITQAAGKEALADIETYLKSKNIAPEQIKHICGPFPGSIAQHPHWITDVIAYFPEAQYHVDAFFVRQLLNETMAQTCQKEKLYTKQLIDNQALFLMHPILLSAEQKITLHELILKRPAIGEAYRFKNELAALFENAAIENREALLDAWYHSLSETKLTFFKHFSETLQRYEQYIVPQSKITIDQRALEKLHIQIIKALTRTKGLKNTENATNMIYFCCGKLKFPYPQNLKEDTLNIA